MLDALEKSENLTYIVSREEGSELMANNNTYLIAVMTITSYSVTTSAFNIKDI